MTDFGAITKDGFVMPIRVYYADTDAGGIVYHANYLEMAERCRSEMVRAFGEPLIGPQGENFIVTKAEIDWLSPARLDDLIICSTVVSNVGAASVDIQHFFTMERRRICEVRIKLVYVSSALKPLKMRQTLREKFSGLRVEPENG